MSKQYTFSVSGHSYRRKFSYTENGVYNELIVPGGASFIQQILNRRNLTEYKQLNEKFRCEYFDLQQFKNEKSKNNYYSIIRHVGVIPGCTVTEPETKPEIKTPYTIVWDEGFGGLSSINTPVFWVSDKALPDKLLLKDIANHCFLMLDADVLRANGAMISRQVSWERTATDLIWQLENNTTFSYLRTVPHTLITFAGDGAVYIKRDGENLTASLVLTHGGSENRLKEGIKGEIGDTFAVMAATVALQFPDIIREIKPLKILPVLKAAEKLMTDGYSIEQLRNSEFYIPDFKDDELHKTQEVSFAIPIGQGTSDPDFWCISNNASSKRIFDIALEYVQKGNQVINSFPKLSFGALTTIDRQEIESYQNVRNLIFDYAGSESVRPLSIAVFGAPGSGKSFGVTQIAKNILPGKVEKLEFNVSQFTDNIDLSNAFHKVRDVILEGKLPLVFFDEFDSDRNGVLLGWLKNFLMPMQDGKFKDESGEHPIGKCILVFAGGTSASFEDFTGPILSECEDKQRKFKDVKGPDFISRLRGTINVLGPNQTNLNDKN